MFFIECLRYIWKSSKETHRFRISFNLGLHQKHTQTPIFMTLFLERMEALSATRPLFLPYSSNLYLEQFTHV